VSGGLPAAGAKSLRRSSGGSARIDWGLGLAWPSRGAMDRRLLEGARAFNLPPRVGQTVHDDISELLIAALHHQRVVASHLTTGHRCDVLMHGG
jgi:hypothetical protein